MPTLQELLDKSAEVHSHLCPRQVLGVRMGMLAGQLLRIDVPQTDKRLFAFVETDGCGMGGISVASGCRVDRRTLRVMDYGKMAATFVDTKTGQAIRIHPHPDCRANALLFETTQTSRWESYLKAYQKLPNADLFVTQPVQLSVSLEKIISRPGLHPICQSCGEEIMNEREVMVDGQLLCQACAGNGYYTIVTLPLVVGQLPSPVPA